jgi:hypothetical protein
MEMPKPGPEHEVLKQMVGSWDGPETLHPSPWDPQGGTAFGRLEARLELDELAVVSDYTQERNGRITFRGHGVYTWDAKRGRYVMTWFDSMAAGTPSIVHGTLQGNTLTFQNQSEHGHGRYVYDFDAPDSYRFRIESSRDGENWTTFMDARFTRR